MTPRSRITCSTDWDSQVVPPTTARPILIFAFSPFLCYPLHALSYSNLQPFPYAAAYVRLCPSLPHLQIWILCRSPFFSNSKISSTESHNYLGLQSIVLIQNHVMLETFSYFVNIICLPKTRSVSWGQTIYFSFFFFFSPQNSLFLNILLKS